MQRKRTEVWMPVIIALIFLLGLIIGYGLNGKIGGSSFFSRTKTSTLQEISNIIKARYVDDINIDSINTLATDEILSHLDPHSVYIAPSDIEQVNNQMEGRFVGVGIIYDNIDDTLTILRLLKNSPAEKAGIQIGDKLLRANDTCNLIGTQTKDPATKKHIKGAEGTTLKLTILRGGVTKQISLQRAAIPIPSISSSYLININTGYIKINKFAERTYEEFMQSLESLQKQKLENLIVDLRGNGGGYMHAATAIADEFLDGDKLIVYTQGNKNEKNEFRCKKEGLFEKGKLVVLVDETSASASEVLAGALQDWDRAAIVGRRSFGKGLVQQQFNLSNGGALRLTVARYYTPLGRNIQKPYDQGRQKYFAELEERYSKSHKNIDTVITKGKTYTTPKGHTVYGGGGIMPDHVVDMDTTLISSVWGKLYLKETYDKFAYKFYILNRENAASFNTTEKIDKNFTFNDSEWSLLQSIATKDSITMSNVSTPVKQEILQQCRADLARIFINDAAYYKEININDSVIKKALELLK